MLEKAAERIKNCSFWEVGTDNVKEYGIEILFFIIKFVELFDILTCIHVLLHFDRRTRDK